MESLPLNDINENGAEQGNENAEPRALSEIEKEASAELAEPTDVEEQSISVDPAAEVQQRDTWPKAPADTLNENSIIAASVDTVSTDVVGEFSPEEQMRLIDERLMSGEIAIGEYLQLKNKIIDRLVRISRE
jgi:hypothetical protein